MKIDKNTQILCNEKNEEGVRIVADWVREDLKRVFGEPAGEPSGYIIVGNDALSDEGLFRESGDPKWEVFKTEPIPEHEDVPAIGIRGSDKRGTMYGLLRISELCGVSPLVEWSDVAPEKKESVEIPKDFYGVSREPSVKYRGIFINDEWPAFGTWATARFGGVNAKCYETIFRLLVRLHANYMWPAMWKTNFSMDGPGLLSAELADRLGIVMSTSHHEPCMRTGEEYRLLRGPESVYGDAWDFLSNREGITKFWEDGLKRNAPFENVITMGMRGERDTAIMANASLEENIALLKDIIRTQNDLIRKNINEDLSKVPRQIVLFTEVEKFYYGDENTPGLIDDPELDGITVVFSDNNYGYTRTLPTKKMRQRNGGYGLYYHVDMHGGAYSYEWIGSTYLPRIRDQLTTAYDYGVRDLWVVNVGDLVSQELEVSYIMKLAYDIEQFGSEEGDEAGRFIDSFIRNTFGSYYKEEDLGLIREIIDRYTLMNERCKHEVMNDNVYHPVNFGEAKELYESSKRVLALCEELLARTPDEIRTAFYELIYYPAYGTANLNRTWMASSWNKYYGGQNRNTANDYNEEIDEGIKADARLIEDFHALAGGKFYGHGLSEHFGFRFWNDSNNQLPTRLYVYPAYKKRMLVSKSDEPWCYDGREYTKREEEIFDLMRPDRDEVTLEISCGSVEKLHYRVKTEAPFLSLSATEGETDKTDVLTVKVDRTKLSDDDFAVGTVVIDDCDECFVTLRFYACTRGYYENRFGKAGVKIPEGTALMNGGYGALDAEHMVSVKNGPGLTLKVLKPYGRSGSGLKIYPNTASLWDVSEEDLPYAEYAFLTDHDGVYEAEFIFAPSLPVDSSNSQCFAYGVNGGDYVVTDTVLDANRPVFNSVQWERDNRRNAKIISTRISLKEGVNTLRYGQIDPNLILLRIVLHDPKMRRKDSYLGPEESYRF